MFGRGGEPKRTVAVKDVEGVYCHCGEGGGCRGLGDG